MSLIGTHEFELKDGRTVILRDPELNDAADMLRYMREVVYESDDFLIEPDEFNVDEEGERKWITEHRDDPGTFAMLAVHDAEVIGILDFRGNGALRRQRHFGTFGISLRTAFRGMRIGTRMIELMLDWGRRHPEIEKIGLSALSTNANAIRLYERLGFIELARSPKHFKLADDAYADNVIMYRFVKPSVKHQ